MGLNQGFKMGNRSAAVSPSHSQLVLPSIGGGSSAKPTDKYKYEQRVEKEQKEKERLAVIRGLNKNEQQEALDQFSLKFYFKKQVPQGILDKQQQEQAERKALLAEPLAKSGTGNVSNLMSQSKNYNLNLKDFGDQEVFEMQNIVDFILRKVAEVILYMQVMNKNIF